MTERSVAIIGAGLAGLACARLLQLHGHTVTVFDKGRGAGGRLSSRRSVHGHFDHGAPALHGTSPAFLNAIARWEGAGLVTPVETGEDSGKAWVGVPTMNSIVRREAREAGAMFGIRIAPLVSPASDTDPIHLTNQAGEHLASASHVVVATPAPQAAELLADISPDLTAIAKSAEMAPCWTVMVTFGEAISPLGDKGNLAAVTGPVLEKVTCENAKPGRISPTGSGQRWVLHATSQWSTDHLEDGPEEVIASLMAAWRKLAPGIPDPTYTAAHRWRYARTSKPAGWPYALCREGRVGVCGDWMLGANAAHAWESGNALGAALATAMGPIEIPVSPFRAPIVEGHC